MKKEIPSFRSEDEERDFWVTHDSVDFLEGAEQVNLEMDAKHKRIVDFTDDEAIIYQRGYRQGSEAEAEISFKEGIQEVVAFTMPILNRISELVSDIRGDWNDPRDRCREIHRLISEWEAKLKEWGITNA